MKNKPRNECPSAGVLQLVVGLSIAGLVQSAAALTPERPAVVGEATMVIGVATLVDGAGASSPLGKGAAIREGDRIETGAGGHVHVRFVDGGRVSVRPASRLLVENYSHASGGASATAIRFRLDEGVVRSITGTWGEAERDRFRLNTPIAAIGVKGTDFIVSTAQGATSASVYNGAIVVAPLAGGCPNNFGPCLNGSEKLLSEDMKGQRLQLDRQQASVQLVPVEVLARARTSVTTSDVYASDARLEKPVAPDGARGSLTSGPRLDQAMVSEERGAVATAGLPPVVTQLVWGRWGSSLEGERFSQSFEDAMKGREVTVGNGSYLLFRNPDTAVPTQLEGSANFRLAAGAANYVGSGGKSEVARIDGAALSVDFSRASFATQLNVTSPSLGTDSVRASGVVASGGLLQSTQGNALVAGALSNDRKEAGYFFEKSLPTGNVNGITLWGR